MFRYLWKQGKNTNQENEYEREKEHGENEKEHQDRSTMLMGTLAS